MRLSIRTRVIIALNAFVICMAFAFGWIAQEVAGEIVEDRFAKEMVSGVSNFIVKNDFPRTQLMMRYLSEMFEADWVVSENNNTNIIASSLSPLHQEAFKKAVKETGYSGVITIGGSQFRMESQAVPHSELQQGQAGQGRIYMLVPYSMFLKARSQAFARVRNISWLAIAIATLVAILLALSITKPISKLATEMDAIAEQEDLGGTKNSSDSPNAPLEISQLSSSFYRLMKRLTEARSELAQNERLATLGKVSLSVAHELRNPLSGIKMNVRVLKDDLEDSSTDNTSCEIILREIDRMELYLNELMNLSPDARPAPKALDFSEVRLSELAESVLDILSGRCRHAKIQVKSSFPRQEPLVSVDRNQIRQAMMNLIVNAIEVMAGGGTLSVAVRNLPTSVVFSVTDSGKGVQCGNSDIFDAFVSGKPNGVGLGLYLCKQIIERHSGRIQYESKEGRTEFWFELPLHHLDQSLIQSDSPIAGNEPRR